MTQKQVRFSSDNISRLGKQGTSEDSMDSAFAKVLDLVEDIQRCIEGEDPHTEKLQKLKNKWFKN